MIALETVIYTSKPEAVFYEPDLFALIGAAQVSNRRRDITGLLVFTGTHFLQVLEGGGAMLDRTLESIFADDRHHEVRIAWRQSLGKRRYGKSAMALLTGVTFADRIATLHGAMLGGPMLADDEAEDLNATLASHLEQYQSGDLSTFAPMRSSHGCGPAISAGSSSRRQQD